MSALLPERHPQMACRAAGRPDKMGPMRRRTFLAATAAAAASPLLTAAPRALAAGAPTVLGAATERGLTDAMNAYGDTGGRWSGADGAYSLPTDYGTLWLFSDTIMGTVAKDGSRPWTSPFIHNSIIVDRGGVLATLTGGTVAAPRSLFAPEGAVEGQRWYWLGDATAQGRRLDVILYEFVRTGNGVFDFAYRGCAVGTADLATGQIVQVTPRAVVGVHWGAAIMELGDWLFIYGVDDQVWRKFLHVAVAPKGALADARQWRYWTGSAWSNDEAASRAVVEGVGNEFSVMPFRGEYWLVSSDAREPLSAKIQLIRADRPQGPFSSPTLLGRTPESGGNLFTYSSKAHPQYCTNDSLLVSYCVNSTQVADVYADVHNYRPRFVRVRLG